MTVSKAFLLIALVVLLLLELEADQAAASVALGAGLGYFAGRVAWWAHSRQGERGEAE